MSSKIQNEDVKSESELIADGGTVDQLINDTKIYVTGNSINKTLDDAITDGDIGGGGGSGFASAGVEASASGTINLSSSDYGKTILCDTSSSTVTVNLPAASAEWAIIIKDFSNNAATNNISVVPDGSDEIDEVAGSDTISNDNAAVGYHSKGDGQIYRVLDFGTSGSAPPTGLGDTAMWKNRQTANLNILELDTGGSATTYGQLNATTLEDTGAFGSSTRWVVGTRDATGENESEYKEYSSGGNTVLHSNAVAGRDHLFCGASSNETTGTWWGAAKGGGTSTTECTKVTIASLASMVDAGDLRIASQNCVSCSSPTEAIIAFGTTSGLTDQVDKRAVASTATTTSFATLSSSRDNASAAGNNTEFLVAGGDSSTAIDKTTYATGGSMTSHGTLTTGRNQAGGTSNQTVMALIGGPGSSKISTVTIASFSQDDTFGTMTSAGEVFDGASCEGHGGLT